MAKDLTEIKFHQLLHKSIDTPLVDDFYDDDDFPAAITHALSWAKAYVNAK